MESEGGNGSLAVDYFTFSSSIADHLKSASLVISHAGMDFIVLDSLSFNNLLLYALQTFALVLYKR